MPAPLRPPARTPLEVVGAGALTQLGGRAVGDDRALAISSSRSQRSASSITWLEISSVVPLAARSWKSCQRSRRSSGSSPTVGSSSTSSSGSPSRAQASETRARWPPESRPTMSPRAVLQRDRSECLVAAGCRDAEHRREVAQVGLHREVGVHGRGLGDVPDAGAQWRCAGRVTEHFDAAAVHALDADDRADQGGLAAAARAEQARDRAARDGEREVVEDRAAAAVYAEVRHVDRG